MGQGTGKETRKKLILVVEDNRVQNEEFCAVVGDAGYESISAHDGVEALQRVADNQIGFGFLKNKIDCILLDWNMPNMNGESFLKEFRRKENRSFLKRSTPVVVLSAYDDDAKRHLGADQTYGRVAAYLVKPIDTTELTKILHRILELGENEELVKMNREWYYQGPKYQEILDKDADHLEKIRNAYVRGEVSKDSYEYALKLFKDCDRDYTFALHHNDLSAPIVSATAQRWHQLRIELTRLHDAVYGKKSPSPVDGVTEPGT
jgi:CheY-like chemotaxis protein